MLLVSPTQWNGPEVRCSDAFSHYLPVNEKTLQCSVYVTGAGRAVVQPGDAYPTSGHLAQYSFDWHRGRTLPEFQLVLVTDGAGEFESAATGNVPCEGAAVFFIFPGVWHRYRPAQEIGWTERWISFNGALAPQLFHSGLIGPRLAVATPHNAYHLAEEFDEVLDSIQANAIQHPMALALQAISIVSNAVGRSLEDAINAGTVPMDVSNYSQLKDPVVQKALELIWSHSQSPLSVSDIARQLPVTRRTLDRRFVEATGRSVLEEINTCRLSRAKRLLTDTDLPVKTVARLAGYTSTERMRVAFVEREGLSPTMYRKKTAPPRENQSQ